MSSVAHGAAERHHHADHQAFYTTKTAQPAEFSDAGPTESAEFSDTASCAADGWEVGDAIDRAGGGRNEWRVHKFLDSLADADGEVTVLRREIAKRCGRSAATATRVLRRLRYAGLLSEPRPVLVDRDQAGPCFANVAPGHKRVQTANSYTVLKRRRPPLVKFDEPLIRVPSTYQQEQEQEPARASTPVENQPPKATTAAEKLAEPRAPAPPGAKLKKLARHEVMRLDPAVLTDLDAAKVIVMAAMGVRVKALHLESDGDPVAAVENVFADLQRQRARQAAATAPPLSPQRPLPLLRAVPPAPDFTPGETPATTTQVIDLYHAACIQLPLFKPERPPQLPCRGSVAWWWALFNRVHTSRFLNGAKGWRAGLPWILKDVDHVRRILSGQYDNDDGWRPSPAPEFVELMTRPESTVFVARPVSTDQPDVDPEPAETWPPLTDDSRALWERVVDRIETKVNRHRFYTWFSPLVLVGQRGDALVVTASRDDPDQAKLSSDWICKHHHDVVSEALAEVQPGLCIAFAGSSRVIGPAPRSPALGRGGR